MKGLEELGTLAKHVRENVDMLIAGQRLAEDSVLSPSGVAFLMKELDIRGVVKYDGSASNEAITGHLLPNGFELQAPLDYRMLFNSPLPGDFTSLNMWQLGSGAASRLRFTENRNMANPHYALEAHNLDSVFGGSGIGAAKTVSFEKDIYTGQIPRNLHSRHQASEPRSLIYGAPAHRHARTASGQRFVGTTRRAQNGRYALAAAEHHSYPQRRTQRRGSEVPQRRNLPNRSGVHPN